MSVRIHQLSKQIGMENKELIELLRSRGFEVTSASSTVDNISAESLVEEFASTQKAEGAAVPESSDTVETAPEAPQAPVLPAGACVKSAEDIKLERDAAAAEAAEAAKPKAPEPVAAPVAPKPAPVSKAPPVAPRPRDHLRHRARKRLLRE